MLDYLVFPRRCTCASLCCCLNLAAIIVTAVFRFNDFGKLSALCLAPSKFDDYESTEKKAILYSSDNTYQSDAAVILWLWIG